VALLLLVPGLGHSLRVNGTAVVSTDPDLLALGAVKGRLPRTALVVTPVEVLYQCARALVRSRLWDPAAQAGPDELPSLDVVLADQVAGLTLERSIAFGAERDPLW
jgi:predicted pyridoxine 5'-phosphate oxidase superfamily flavin-nucleotide-binding protein